MVSTNSVEMSLQSAQKQVADDISSYIHIERVGHIDPFHISIHFLLASCEYLDVKIGTINRGLLYTSGSLNLFHMLLFIIISTSSYKAYWDS